MMKFLVYLAGPIAGLSYDDSVEWRAAVTDAFPKQIKTISPMSGTIDLVHETSLQHSYEGKPLTSSRGLTTRDRYAVMRSDLILVNFLGAPAISIGSVMEIAWADILRKPIVLAMAPGNLHWHPMIRECAGFIVPTLREAVQVATDILLPDISFEGREHGAILK